MCKSCYRGHKYCSDPCREAGYARVRREARVRFEKSQEAKLDHCDRSRRYRESHRGVTDKGSGLRPKLLCNSPEKHLNLTILPARSACIGCGKEVWNERSLSRG